MPFIFKRMKCMPLFWNMFHASLLTTDKGSSWQSIRSVEKIQLWKRRSSHSISFLFGAVGPGFKFMSPESNRINLKYDPYLFKSTLDSASSWKTSPYFLFPTCWRKNACCCYQLLCSLIVWQYFKHFQLAAFSPYGVLTFKWICICATQKKPSRYV